MVVIVLERIDERRRLGVEEVKGVSWQICKEE